MTTLVGLAMLAAVICLAILVGKARTRAAVDAMLDASAGRDAEARARVEATADNAARAARAQEAIDVIDDADSTQPGVARIGARWERIRVLRDGGDR